MHHRSREGDTIEVTVANTNVAPSILAMPLQLISEGDTLSFTLLPVDADGDAVNLALLHDASTPAGVSFDPNSGYFEWTPSADIVDNATLNDRPFTFNFTANGVVTTQRSVQVRVFDVNREPRLHTSSHGVLVGQSLSLPVILGSGAAPSNAIVAIDDDGAAQTQALTVSFANLPEGASYDAQTRRFNWTPGPGQIGDFVITAQVSDGRNTTSQTFTLRVVAEVAANAPKILVSTTPSTPAQPGQTIVATVRAQGYSPIQSLVVQVRGPALSTGVGVDPTQWQTVALDGLGRLRLTPSQPGLIEVQVTATDQDGFSNTSTHTVRVKDPADTQAPALAWGGVLQNATAFSQPVTISELTAVQASLQEMQLMGYKLEIAPAGSAQWTTLVEQYSAPPARRMAVSMLPASTWSASVCPVPQPNLPA